MKSVFWSLLQTFFNKGFSLFFSIILGNLILADEMGVYFSIIMVVNYAVSLLSFQVGSSIVQKLNDVNIKHLNNLYFTSGLFLTIIIAFLVVLSMYVCSPPIAYLFKLENQIYLLKLTFPLIAIQMMRDYFTYVLRAKLMLMKLAIIFFSIRLLQVFSMVVILKYGYGLDGVIASVYLGEILSTICLAIVSFNNFRFVFTSEIGKIGLNIFQFGSKIQLGMVATFLNKNIDVFFVNYYLSKQQLAFYSYASKFALMFLLFSNSISTVTYPMLTKSFSSNQMAETNKIYSVSIKMSFFILSVLSLILMFHFQFLVNLILPPDYQNAKLALIILLFGLILFSSFATIGTIFSSRGTPGLSAISAWIGLIIILGLSPWFIPRFGIEGAAVVMSISFLFRVIVGMVMVEKVIGLRFEYGRFIIAYVIYLLFGFIGAFKINDYLTNEFLIIIYTLTIFFFLLGTVEKNFIGRKFNDWKEHIGYSN